jgi:ADP-heptose:LPS heptosyltransferase
MINTIPGSVPVDCEYASCTLQSTFVTCSLGLFAGRPHVAMCADCPKRQPRKPINIQITKNPPGHTASLAPRDKATPRPPKNKMKPTNGQCERLILRSFLSPGDIIMMTAAVRELHKAYPGRFETAVETSVPEIWEHNPMISRDRHPADSWRVLEMHYPLINQSNQRPVHFLQGYAEYLSQQLNLPIPITDFRGDIHLSHEEKRWTNQLEEKFGYRGRFWIIMAGGKHDFTTKWWPPDFYQQVVDHFLGRIQFVQCGQKDHWHPPLQGVFDLIGQTSMRQFIRLMYHAEGVICPITFAMHLAAAVPIKGLRLRPCVVIAGGREPPHWEAYPGHQFLHTIGCLPCCANGGCWKSRCQPINDGDPKDQINLCERPVQITPNLRIPQCMILIKPEDIIRCVERALIYDL